MKRLNKVIVCGDGTKISVQASEFHYCWPRNDEGPYVSLEVAMVGKGGLMPYAPTLPFAPYGDPKQQHAVYEHVPAKMVLDFIEAHGGIVSGELPEVKV